MEIGSGKELEHLAQNRKLITDADFMEAMERRRTIRVFQDNHIVDSGGTIVRFDEQCVVIQSGVSQIAYHDRNVCEFFESRGR